jgi:hypothetical protein
MTLSAWWGVSAAPGRDEPYGRAGPWAPECAAIDRAYGPGRVLHVSFEEFARTFTSREQVAERWREGGVPVREIRRRLREPDTARAILEFHEAFARFRAFDRPEVLHLYGTFLPSRAFHREFPEAVQCGPFWPEAAPGRGRRVPGRWVWYASPGSSPLLAARLAEGWEPSLAPVRIEVRAPGKFPLPSAPNLRWSWLRPLARPAWRRRFADSGLKIVTGSRTLLEALVDGGPFLYFNGVLGHGAFARRHRPEKIDALLALWRSWGVPASLRHDLAEFSRARSVGPVLARARSDPDWRRRFPRRLRSDGFRTPYDDAGELIERTARAFAAGRWSAAEVVAALRSGAGPPRALTRRAHHPPA